MVSFRGSLPGPDLWVFYFTITTPELLSVEVDGEGVSFTSVRGTTYQVSWGNPGRFLSLWNPTQSTVQRGTNPPCWRVFTGRLHATVPEDAYDEIRTRALDHGLELVPRPGRVGWDVLSVRSAKMPPKNLSRDG